jgi:hypothetical protein
MSLLLNFLFRKPILINQVRQQPILGHETALVINENELSEIKEKIKSGLDKLEQNLNEYLLYISRLDGVSDIKKSLIFSLLNQDAVKISDNTCLLVKIILNKNYDHYNNDWYNGERIKNQFTFGIFYENIDKWQTNGPYASNDMIANDMISFVESDQKNKKILSSNSRNALSIYIQSRISQYQEQVKKIIETPCEKENKSIKLSENLNNQINNLYFLEKCLNFNNSHSELQSLLFSKNNFRNKPMTNDEEILKKDNFIKNFTKEIRDFIDNIRNEENESQEKGSPPNALINLTNQEEEISGPSL